MSLLAFVRQTADAWAQNQPVEETILEEFDRVRAQLEQIGSRYQPPAPPGGEEVRELMLESIQFFTRALDCLEQYLEEENPKLLKLAVDSAQEGEDVLESVQYAIEQSQETTVITD